MFCRKQMARQTARVARTRARGVWLALILAGVVALLSSSATAAAAPGPAFSDPSTAQYDSSVEQVEGQVPVGEDGAAPARAGEAPRGDGVGGLPFTGLDVAIVIAVGAALLGSGMVLRRLSGPSVPR